MPRIIKFILFLIIATLVVLYINNGIATYDMRFYRGKDGGYFLRFESICILSTFYFALMTVQNRILDGLKGLGFGFIFGILSYLITMIIVPDPYDGTAYYILSSLLFIVTFYILEKRRIRKINYS